LVYGLYTAMEGKGWVTAAEMAQATGVPRQNFNATLRRMVSEGVVERNDELWPLRFTVARKPSHEVRTKIGRIKAAAAIYGETR
jgi:DNA-binding IclR family transcriptional regulator